MRRAILQAARQLFVKEGYDHVSMRKIAERIDYSPAALYLYFPAKDDIFFALAEEGFRAFQRDDGGARGATTIRSPRSKTASGASTSSARGSPSISG